MLWIKALNELPSTHSDRTEFTKNAKLIATSMIALVNNLFPTNGEQVTFESAWQSTNCVLLQGNKTAFPRLLLPFYNESAQPS